MISTSKVQSIDTYSVFYYFATLTRHTVGGARRQTNSGKNENEMGHNYSLRGIYSSLSGR